MRSSAIPISVGVPAHRRVGQLRRTLQRISACDPRPDEIIVHLDGQNPRILDLLGTEFPTVHVIHSPKGEQGPGGARNLLADSARHTWLANFDDDSYPAESDFFSKAWNLIQSIPDAAVISGTTAEENLEPGSLWLQAVYPGSCHILNRRWFTRTTGYTPLPIAYNMEEVDVSIQLHALGAKCLQAAELKIIHDHPPPQKETLEIQVGMLLNTTLFPALRYPWVGFPHAVGSVLSRIFRTLYQRDSNVVRSYFVKLPSFLRQHLHRRSPVSLRALSSWLLLRRQAVRVLPPS